MNETTIHPNRESLHGYMLKMYFLYEETQEEFVVRVNSEDTIQHMKRLVEIKSGKVFDELEFERNGELVSFALWNDSDIIQSIGVYGNTTLIIKRKIEKNKKEKHQQDPDSKFGVNVQQK